MNARLNDLWQTAAWRLEAWRTGEPFDRVAQRHRVIYEVEQLFLVRRATGQWLLHLAADPALADDTVRAEAMLSEIRQFAREYLTTGYESRVEEFRAGELEVWIAPGHDAFLAAVVRGDPPNQLRAELQDTIARIHAEYAQALAAFDGNASAFQAAAPLLTPCLRSAYKPMPETPRFRVPRRKVLWPAAAALTLFVAIATALSVRSQLRWRSFITRLKAEPGILVAAAEHERFGVSRVAGLRDPRARDPAVVAKEAKVNPARIQFEWKEYSAADPAIAQRQSQPATTPMPTAAAVVQQSAAKTLGGGDAALEKFKNAFPLPANVTANVANGTLVLAGSAPYEWVSAVQAGAPKIAGITGINGDDLVVEFDPELVLQRFREQFGILETVKANLRSGRLTLTGEAPHEWLRRVRRGAMHIAGIHVLDDRKVEDIDQRAFTESKAAVEEASVLFGLSRDSVRPDATPVLERIAEEARRCFTAAANLGVNVRLEVRGYGDAIAAEVENRELSQRRAEAVCGVLAASGVEREKMDSSGLGAPPRPEPGEKSGAGKFDRRVFFRVVIQP